MRSDAHSERKAEIIQIRVSFFISSLKNSKVSVSICVYSDSCFELSLVVESGGSLPARSLSSALHMALNADFMPLVFV